MVMLKTHEPRGWESTAVFSQELADYSWEFVGMDHPRTPPTAALLTTDRHVHSVHTEISSEADDFATAFFPLYSKRMKVDDL